MNVRRAALGLFLTKFFFLQASFEGSYKVVELLLEEGADKNTKNRWGQTPLQEAMENRLTASARVLSSDLLLRADVEVE